MIELQPFTAADTDRLRGWVTTPQQMLWWTGNGLEHPLDREQMEQVLERARRSGGHVWRVVAGGAAVGHVELHPDRGHPTGVVARVLVDPARRGEGIATAMMRAVVSFGFDRLDLHRLELRVIAGNAAAEACYRRVGFRREGLLRETRMTADGRRWDTIVMGMLATDPRG